MILGCIEDRKFAWIIAVLFFWIYYFAAAWANRKDTKLFVAYFLHAVAMYLALLVMDGTFSVVLGIIPATTYVLKEIVLYYLFRENS